MSGSHEPAELEAASVARHVAGGSQAPEISAVSPASIQREGEGDEQTNTGASGASGWTLDQLLDGIQLNYDHQLTMQRDAVTQDFAQAADDVDPPPLWQSLLIGAAEVALSAATAGIGGAIARSCVSAAAKTTADVVKSAVANAIKASIQGAISAAAGHSSNPLEIFIAGQRDTLTDAMHAQQTAMIGQRTTYQSSETGQQDALDLYNSQEQAEPTVRTTQFNEVVTQWTLYLAHQEHGIHNEGQDDAGTDLGDQIGDTSGKGVLGLEVEAYSDLGRAVHVINAEIEGLNENLGGCSWRAWEPAGLCSPRRWHGKPGGTR